MALLTLKKELIMRHQTGNQHTGNTGSNAHQGHTSGNRGNTNTAANSNRGFGAMSDTKHKEASAKGGRAAHDQQARTDTNRNTHTTKKDPPMGPAKNK
jgi:hypothetical protein